MVLRPSLSLSLFISFYIGRIKLSPHPLSQGIYMQILHSVANAEYRGAKKRIDTRVIRFLREI